MKRKRIEHCNERLNKSSLKSASNSAYVYASVSKEYVLLQMQQITVKNIYKQSTKHFSWSWWALAFYPAEDYPISPKAIARIGGAPSFKKYLLQGYLRCY